MVDAAELGPRSNQYVIFNVDAAQVSEGHAGVDEDVLAKMGVKPIVGKEWWPDLVRRVNPLTGDFAQQLTNLIVGVHTGVQLLDQRLVLGD